ncbi:hypothetical protein A2982_00670 [candidate division WWE3 bacterium RIFCSPLOWO2_01_FULL_39_13]|uniref:Uncharacterized protein n=1 Tax=candidate division WWE3 bacterium RIFCSPLOWO2_01_FULL_39_13 TaxID=1802624 RepID=A0A1F4V3P4_UNCKA|nr:MAG: hypothetical protein A2982_00670 [candidate division WWE3 bacterium RIFCSPLOWO2_01_FULL_39_13]
MLLNRLVNKSKIINVGYPVEVELPESQINDLYGIWKGIVLGETRLKIAGLEQKNYPPVFGVQQNGKIIRCYLSRREFNYRKYLHLYLLDKSTKKEVYEAVKSDFDAYASDLYLLARIDMEVFSFNKTIHGGSIKKMAEKVRILYEYFLRNGVEFIHLDELVPSDKNSQCLSKYQISCNTQEDNKWGSQALQDQVKIRLNTQSVCSTCRYLHLLSLMCSDYYCTESKDIVLTGESLARQKVIIVKDRRYRDPESSVKLQLVGSENSQENNRIIKRIKDSDIKKYFIHYLKAVNEVEKILR